MHVRENDFMRFNDNNSTIKRQSYLGALTHILGEGADCLYVSREDVLSKEEELFPLMFIGRPSLKDYIFPEQFYKHNNSVRVFNDYATDFAYFTRDALVRCKYTQPISSNLIATLKLIAESDCFSIKTSKKNGTMQKIVAKGATKYGNFSIAIELTGTNVAITKKINQASGEEITITMNYDDSLDCLQTLYEKKEPSIARKSSGRTVCYEDEFYYNDLGFEIKHLSKKSCFDDEKLYVQKREVLRVIDTIKRCAYKAVNEFTEVQDENVKNQRLENHTYLFGCDKDLSLNMRRFETKQATKQLYDLVASMIFENGSSMMLINSVDKSMEFEKEWQNLQNADNLGRK